MLLRFSLYGFLKNQRYFEPFLWLAFLDKGLSFTLIGALIGFREICINVMEIPTGAVADSVGRRRAMIFSFVAYIISFLVFAISDSVWMLFAAMLLFSVGEAFRTGTHKAIIFDWLDREGRRDEKTRVYGFTRSWSKIGSAVNVVIAAGLLFTICTRQWDIMGLTVRGYSWLFLLCIIPYAANIVNFMTYPSYLDGPKDAGGSLKGIITTLVRAIRRTITSRPLRRLLAESMGFEGVYKASGDYIQPLLKTAALSLPIMLALNMQDRQRTAILVAAVNLPLFLLGAAASRRAHRLVERAGSPQRGARWLWAANLGAFCVMAAGILTGWVGVAIAAFVGLAIIQNFWRPILISRFATHAEPAEMATLLSVESQSKSFAAAIAAPLLGLAVDQAASISPELRFAPVAMLGMAVAAIMLATSPKR